MQLPTRSVRFRTILSERPRGQVIVMLAVGIFVTMGAAALAVDVGRLWTTKRIMQTAADAAALAGADSAAVDGSSTAVASAAKAAAGQNGFTDGSTSTSSPDKVTVTVNYPPTSGTYKGVSGVVQVIITQQQPTYFLSVLGFSTMPVSATADAITTGSGSCVYSLDPTISGAMTVQGTSSVTSACGVYVNSDNSSALIASGGGVVSAPLIGIVGGSTLNGGGSTSPTTGIAAFGDPLGWVSEPTVGACDYNNMPTITKNTTLSPGNYCGGIKLTSSGTTINFNPGLYIIDGGSLDIGSGVTVNGSGVTFYLTGLNTGNSSNNAYGGVTINGGATVNLSAPCDSSSGGIEGILFFQDRSITNGQGSTINGGSASSFTGALYFSTTSLNYSGDSSSSGYTLLVADTLTISGNAVVGNNYSCLADGPLIKDAALAL